MKRRNGAAGVMVIFIVIVLSTLGVFAVSSSMVGLRFARKAVVSNEEFYVLDTRAEEMLAAIDLELYKAAQTDDFWNVAAENLNRLSETEEGEELIILPFFDDNINGSVSAISIEASIHGSERSNLKLSFDVSGPDRRVVINEWRLINAPFEYNVPEDLWLNP